MSLRVGTDPLVEWALQIGEKRLTTPLFVQTGSPAARRENLERFLSPQFAALRAGAVEDLTGSGTETWIHDGVLKNVTTRIGSMRIPRDVRKLPIWFPPEKGEWELLWALAGAHDFIIQEPLRTIVDHGAYRAHDFYRLIWEARFLSKENVNLAPAQALVETIVRWLCDESLTSQDVERIANVGVSTPTGKSYPCHRYDLLCMLLTMVTQNGFLKRSILYFDGLENALSNRNRLRDLWQFLCVTDRWAQLDYCPLGVLIGFDARSENLEALRVQHPKFAARAEANMWASSSEA